jgi:hypothetical protein
MRVRSKAILAAIAVLAIASGACSKVGNLQARKSFKEANGMYQAQNYKEAVVKYQQVLASDPNFITKDGVTPYFFIANSYDNQYKPARKGEAENDGYLTKAIENYKTASEKDTNPKMKNLALDYLVYAYGPEKLNDPSQAEPILAALRTSTFGPISQRPRSSLRSGLRRLSPPATRLGVHCSCRRQASRRTLRGRQTIPLLTPTARISRCPMMPRPGLWRRSYTPFARKEIISRFQNPVRSACLTAVARCSHLRQEGAIVI